MMEDIINKDEILFFPSLLSPELIRTELVTEKYDTTDEPNYQSLTYLSKSLNIITRINYAFRIIKLLKISKKKNFIISRSILSNFFT